MDNRNVEKINTLIKVLKWLFVMSALLIITTMVRALVTNNVPIFNYVLMCVESICSLLVFAFICSKAEIIPKEEK